MNTLKGFSPYQDMTAFRLENSDIKSTIHILRRKKTCRENFADTLMTLEIGIVSVTYPEWRFFRFSQTDVKK